MNEMTMLHDFGRKLDIGDGAPPPRLRQRVNATMTSRRRLRPYRTPAMRLGWRLTAAGCLAGILVLAMLAVQTVSIGDHAPPATAEAAAILQRAAQTAAGTPVLAARPDQFLYVETAYRSYPPGPGLEASGQVVIGTTPATVPEGGTERIWWSVDGTRDGLQRFEPDVHGLGDNKLYGCRDGRQAVHPAEGAPSTGPSATSSDGTRSCTPRRAYRDDLPTNEDAMRRYLYGNVQSSDQHQDVFLQVANLNSEVYVPPAARAALFEVAAAIPGVRVVRNVTDAAGRSGIAVTRDLDQGSEDGKNYQRVDLIFDPVTYQFLGTQTVLTRQPPGVKIDVPRVISQTAMLRVGIVDEVGQQP